MECSEHKPLLEERAAEIGMPAPGSRSPMSAVGGQQPAALTSWLRMETLVTEDMLPVLAPKGPFPL